MFRYHQHSRRACGTWLLMAVVLYLANAQIAVAEENHYYSSDGVAIEGYDPVAYFTQSAAQLGSSRYSYKWGGTTWNFISAANREAFIANPEGYAPQYGGYCAWAAANNYIFEIDPKAFSIHNNRLYLNAGFGTRVRWALDKDGNISKADKNWPELRTRLH